MSLTPSEERQRLAELQKEIEEERAHLRDAADDGQQLIDIDAEEEKFGPVDNSIAPPG